MDLQQVEQVQEQVQEEVQEQEQDQEQKQVQEQEQIQEQVQDQEQEQVQEQEQIQEQEQVVPRSDSGSDHPMLQATIPLFGTIAAFNVQSPVQKHKLQVYEDGERAEGATYKQTGEKWHERTDMEQVLTTDAETRMLHQANLIEEMLRANEGVVCLQEASISPETLTGHLERKGLHYAWASNSTHNEKTYGGLVVVSLMGMTEVQEIKITKLDGGETIVGLAVRVGRDIIVNFHVKFHWGERMLEEAIKVIYRLYLAQRASKHHSIVIHKLDRPVKIVCAGDFNMGEDRIEGLIRNMGYNCEFHQTTVIAEGSRTCSRKVDHVFSISLRKCEFCEKTIPIHVSAPDDCYSNPKNKINELCPNGSKCKSYRDESFLCKYLIHPEVECPYGSTCKSQSFSYFCCKFSHPPPDRTMWRRSGGGGGGGGGGAGGA